MKPKEVWVDSEYWHVLVFLIIKTIFTQEDLKKTLMMIFKYSHDQ